MGNGQSTFSQQHLVDPVDARLTQAARARTANRASQQQAISQHRDPSVERRTSTPRSHGESAGAIMSPSQHSSGQREASTPTRPANRRSSSRQKTPPSQNGSHGQRSNRKSKSPTSSKKSASQQPVSPENNQRERSFSGSIVPTSPRWYPETFKDDTSSEGSNDPEDPCREIRHGRRRLREVLGELQEMHRVTRADNTALDDENDNLHRENSRLLDDNERLQNDSTRLHDDNARLRDYNQDLHLDNERLRDTNRQLHEEIQGLQDDVQYRSAANRQAGTRLQDLWNEIEDLRETNGDPQNENAELRRSNRNLRADLHDHLEMYEENQTLQRYNRELGHELEDLRRQTGGGIADWTRRFDELQQIAIEHEDTSGVLRRRLQDTETRLAETTRQLGRAANEIIRLQTTQAEADRLRLQLRGVEEQLTETNQDLDRANNENNRLQATLAQVNEGNSDSAGSQAAQPGPVSRGSSASRGASRPGARGPTPRDPTPRDPTPRDPTPEAPPRPSLPRGRRNVPTAAATTTRMNTRSQVTGDARRTPPPELFNPRRSPPATTARGQQRNASKPAGVSKSKKQTKTRRGRK